MHHLANWIEIPVTNITRATAFYEALLGVEMVAEFILAGRKYALFPSSDRHNAGAIVEGDGYVPSRDGPLIYLNATGHIDEMAARLHELNADVIMEKTWLSDEAGEVILFADCEGNRIGLQAGVTPAYKGDVSDAKMKALIDATKPTIGFILRVGEHYGEETMSSVWGHARNMFNLLRDGTLVHVSNFVDGSEVLGFGISRLPTAEALSAVLEADPAIACGRLSYEILTTMSFDGPTTDFREG